MKPTLEDLVYLADCAEGTTEKEALKAIDEKKGFLDMNALFESGYTDDDARDAVVFLSKRMKTKKSKDLFFEAALVGSLSYPRLIKTRKAVIDLAVSWGFDIQNQITIDNGTMLAVAASFGRFDMVKELLDIGISPEGRKPGEVMEMLILYADDENDRFVRCAKLLYEAGAVITEKNVLFAGGQLKALFEQLTMRKNPKIKQGKPQKGKLGKYTV